MSKENTSDFSELTRDYFLGNYQSSINRAISSPEEDDSILYLCLSYCGLHKYDNALHETSSSSEYYMNYIKLYIQCLKKERDQSSVINESGLRGLNSDTPPGKQRRREVFLEALIYVHFRLYTRAITLLDGQLMSHEPLVGFVLPLYYIGIQALIQINRLDLAEKWFNRMQNIDALSSLTTLTKAQLKLVTNNPRETFEIISDLLDASNKPTPLLKNIQTAAAICFGDYEGAKQLCEESLDMDNDNPEALINIVHILTKLRSSSDIRERHLGRLITLHPEHDFVKDFKRLTDELKA